MRLFPHLVRGLLTLLVLALGLSAVPAARAQPEQDDTATRGRGPRFERDRPFERGSMRGFNPEEAKEAQKLYDEGLAYEAAGRDNAALGRYKRLTKRYPRSKVAPEAFYRMAQIYLEKKNLPRAFNAIDAIVRAHPEFGRFNELISEEYNIAYTLIKADPKKLLGFIPGVSHRERGIEFFERLVFNAPYSDYAPLALMNVAETYIDQDENDAAIFTLDRLITTYPNSIVTSDAYLLMARTHEGLVDGPLYDQGATREAINHYEDFLILFPQDAKVGEAETGLARTKEDLAQSRMKMADFYYFKRSRYQAAKVFYNEAITIAPTSEAAQLARERLARLEVDEAAAEARKVELAGKPQREGFFGLFRKAKTIEPIVPNDPTVTEPAPAPGTVTPQSGPSAEVRP